MEHLVLFACHVQGDCAKNPKPATFQGKRFLLRDPIGGFFKGILGKVPFKGILGVPFKGF